MSLFSELNDFLLSYSLVRTSVSPTTTLADPTTTLLKLYPLPTIFSALTTALLNGREDDISTCTSALAILLRLPSVISLLTTPADLEAMQSAFTSPDPRVRCLPAELFSTLAKGVCPWPPGIPRASVFAHGGALLDTLVCGLEDPEPRIADLCGEGVVGLGGGGVTQGEVTSLLSSLLSFTQHKVARGSIGFVRALGVVGRLCGCGEGVSSGVFEGGLGALLFEAARDDSDPLLQISVLEYLGPLGASPRALSALLSSPLLPALIQWGGLGGGDTSGEGDPLLADASLTALADIHSRTLQGPTRNAMREAVLPGLLRLVAKVCDGEVEGRDPLHVIGALGVMGGSDEGVIVGLLEEGNLEYGPSTTTSDGSGSGSAPSRGGAGAMRFRSAIRSWLELVESSSRDSRAAALSSLARCMGGVGKVPYALPLVAWLGRACYGDSGAGGSEGERVRTGMKVLEGVFAARVPPGDAGNESAHWAKSSCYTTLATLASIPGEEGLRAVYHASASPKLWAALVEGAAPESSVAGREGMHRVLAVTVDNPCALKVLGEEALSKVRTRFGRGAHAKPPMVPTVLVAGGEYI